ncbi:bis(5'-nucleosyl)-tetraphosphatase (symmetrical) YqeK [Halalkalibacter urbisdiaboli]|uniref:bis(5'-nucleosyl)-tetraphosphatase (symmetrical) YqeK n=1 Tax=Halalkalibacter urbisdiaboli TaxID=1960589 RepID=UPI000B42D2B5|nr:bis(5'-nucleosyl)-tetraphosphatase (symmetrical) YqeK [Halalkalibacter urbisdiaboli]
MERNEALEIVKPHLTKHRYEHTLGVMETAIRLAERFGADKKKTELAAIFHDYAKFRDKEEMRLLVQNVLSDRLILEYGTELLHAPCGAYYVEHEVGINDSEILDAIRFHTTGRPGMTLLDKIIFLADYIEPGRTFPGVEHVRELAENDLDAAVVQAIENTIAFLMKRRQLIFPETVATFNSLVKDKKREK